MIRDTSTRSTLPRRRFVAGLGALAVGGPVALTACSQPRPPRPASLPPSTVTRGALPNGGPSAELPRGTYGPYRAVVAGHAIAVSTTGDHVAAIFAGEGSNAAGAPPNGVVVWRTGDQKVDRRFPDERVGILAWQPGLDVIAVGSGGKVEATSLRGDILWTLSRDPSAARKYPQKGSTDLSFSQDGALLTSALDDGSVRIWKQSSETWSPGPVLDLRDSRPRRVAVSPDGGSVAVACEEGPARIFSTTTGAPQHALTAIKQTPRTVAYASDGSLLVSSGIGWVHTAADSGRTRLHIWTPASGLKDGPPARGEHASWVVPHPKRPLAAVVADGGQQLAVWDLRAQRMRDLPLPSRGSGRPAWDPRSEKLYLANEQHGLLEWTGSVWKRFEAP